MQSNDKSYMPYKVGIIYITVFIYKNSMAYIIEKSVLYYYQLIKLQR